jgi:hypothetical protein
MRLEDFDNDEDKVIQDKLKQKTWNEIRTNDSWAIFKIMAEFVNGYETMARIGPCVTIFGSARIKPEHEYYKLAEKIAYNNGFNEATVFEKEKTDLMKTEY